MSLGSATGSGTNDNDLVIEFSGTIDDFDTYQLSSTAGAMDVFVSLDGTNYTTAPLSLSDLGAVSSDPVLVTAANRMYGFRGKYRAIQVRQNGGTPVTGAVLNYGTMSR